jgi:hypothetical protein
MISSILPICRSVPKLFCRFNSYIINRMFVWMEKEINLHRSNSWMKYMMHNETSKKNHF